MPRAIWKGAISFSLVNVPVGLYKATEADQLDLDMIDKRDFSPVGFKRYSKKTGKEVEWRDIVKGYEYKKGDYVVLTDEDFKRANVKASRTIDIQVFVDRASIEPYYFETPYYLLPEGPGEKVYALLRDAMAKADKVAIAQFVLRNREHLATLLAEGDVLMLNTMRFAQEILPQPKVEGGRRAASGKELQTAMQLINQMSDKWQPKKYRDTYRDDLMKRIKQKVKAGEAKTLTKPEKGEEPEEERGKVIDLMSVLRQSLDENRRGPKRATQKRGGGSRKEAS